MRWVISFLVVFLFVSFGFGKNVVIFEFYNKDGNNIPTASVGVLKSILQYAKFFPSARISDSKFDVKGRDIKDIIKAVPGYDNYIVGYYSYKNNVYYYDVTIYDQNSQGLVSFSASSEDLFEIADYLMNRIFSFYSGKNTGFATLEIQLRMITNKKYTIVINDEVLMSSTPNTNISVRIVSKVPYNILVRDDETKELVYDRTVVLVDNEISKLLIEPKKVNIVDKVITQDVQTDKIVKEIDEIIRYRLIFNDKVIENIKPQVDLLPLSVRNMLYEKHRIGLGITILSCGLNLIPGLGSLIIGDTGGIAIVLLTPYITLAVAGIAEEGSLVRGVFGIISIVGYGYNLVRPLIYQSQWNSKLEAFLKPNKHSYIQLDVDRVSLNVRF